MKASATVGLAFAHTKEAAAHERPSRCVVQIHPPSHALMTIAVAPVGIFEEISAVANAIILVSLAVLMVIALPVAWRFRKTYRKIQQLLDRTHGDLSPILQHINVIGDNLSYITTSIRQDVHKVNAVIGTATDRVEDAVAQAERRVSEFNALLAVVQQEAEQLFLSTASTVRGVQRGAAAFGKRGGMDLASEELDAAEPADDLEIQEEGDGHNGSSKSAAQALPAAPRVRPRARSNRGGRA